MITKQELINHLKTKGEYLYFSDISGFLKQANVTKIIGFAEGSLFVDSDAPVKFTNVTDLVNKLENLNLGDKVTATFNAVAKPGAAIALTVIRVFTEVLGYKVKKITALKVDFEK